MHQIIVDIIRFQPAQFLLKAAFDPLGADDLVLGQLGGDVHLFSQVVPGKDLAQTGLVAHVQIGRVEIVHAQFDGAEHLLFRLVDIEGSALAGKAHTAEAQRGNGIAIAVFTILHESFGPPFAASFCPRPNASQGPVGCSAIPSTGSPSRVPSTRPFSPAPRSRR